MLENRIIPRAHQDYGNRCNNESVVVAFIHADLSEETQQRSVRALEIYLIWRMLYKMEGYQLNLVIEMLDLLKIKRQQVNNVIAKFLKDQSFKNCILVNKREVIDYLTMFSMLGNKAWKTMVFEVSKHTSNLSL